MDPKGYLPILSLIVGWYLHELSTWFRSLGEKKRNLSVALVELLEIRYALLTERLIKKELSEISPLGDLIPAFQTIFDNLLIDMEEISKRYNAAIDTISTYDPFFAFQLRHKEKVKLYLSAIRKLGADDKSVIETLDQFSNAVVDQIVPAIEQAAIDLAWRHSPYMWFRTRVNFRRKLELPESAHEILRQLRGKINESKRSPDAA